MRKNGKPTVWTFYISNYYLFFYFGITIKLLFSLPIHLYSAAFFSKRLIVCLTDS